jgi:hypothetical protein
LPGSTGGGRDFRLTARRCDLEYPIRFYAVTVNRVPPPPGGRPRNCRNKN